ncbi:MAG: tRNA (N(6)-L-threonylcarbamoyladenosine(37)-C(2))-methylthiotransferase MtaB [Terriglobia bacterium]
MRFHVENFGCRATQADGAALEEQFRQLGYRPAGEAPAAEVVVVNTCTVTAAADQQARQYVRRLHEKNPAARILVTGCYAQRAPAELAGLPGVAWVVDNSHKPAIGALIERELGRAAKNFISLERLRHPTGPAPPAFGPAPTPAEASEGVELSIAAQPAKVITGNILEQKAVLVAPAFGSSAARGADRGSRTRPTLKIQDGCNNRCAYCVIPFVRGRSRSLPGEEVIAQVRRLVATGYKEIVLSGVDLGSYGLDLRPRRSLLALTERLLTDTLVPLLRFSSLEPMDLSDDFVDLLASSRRIARHIHAPLQSGSNRILRRMRRWYSREEYAERIGAAAAALPGLGLGADVIVGFPGESEADFRATYEVVEQLPFSYLHIFSFSPRPGTAAATLPDAVPATVIKERHRALRQLAAEKAARFRAQQVGRVLRVLTLGTTNPDGTRNALSENYLKVHLPATLPSNQLLFVRVSRLAEEALRGEPLGAGMN